ncbi:hypothetical protein Tco_1372978 [Tanacetum coccineum]
MLFRVSTRSNGYWDHHPRPLRNNGYNQFLISKTSTAQAVQPPKLAEDLIKGKLVSRLEEKNQSLEVGSCMDAVVLPLQASLPPEMPASWHYPAISGRPSHIRPRPGHIRSRHGETHPYPAKTRPDPAISGQDPARPDHIR